MVEIDLEMVREQTDDDVEQLHELLTRHNPLICLQPGRFFFVENVNHYS